MPDDGSCIIFRPKPNAVTEDPSSWVTDIVDEVRYVKWLMLLDI